MTLIITLPLWVRLVSGQEVVALGEMTILKGIFLIPTSPLLEHSARRLCDAALVVAWPGCGYFLSMQYLRSLQPQRVSVLQSWAQVNHASYSLSLPASLLGSVAFPAIGLGSSHFAHLSQPVPF